MKRLVFFLILVSSMAFGQGSVMRQDSQDASNVAGALKATVAKFDNLIGSANIAIEVKFSGGPATSSIPVLGCMRGGTCQTVVTLSTTVNQMTFVNTLYDYVSLTPVLTGGSNPFVTFNYTAISQSSGSSFLLDSQNRIVISGPGSTNGLAQSLAVFALPNSITAASPGVPIVLAAVTAAVNIKGSAGTLYQIHALNTTAAVCYIQLFTLTSGSVTLGTTTPVQVLGLPANGTGTLSAIPFGMFIGTTGISVAATTTPTGAATCATGAMVSALAQ